MQLLIGGMSLGGHGAVNDHEWSGSGKRVDPVVAGYFVRHELGGDSPLEGCEVKIMRRPQWMRLKRKIEKNGDHIDEGEVEGQIQRIGDPADGVDHTGKEKQEVNEIDKDQVNATGVENDQVMNTDEIHAHTDKVDRDDKEEHNNNGKEEDEKPWQELKEILHLTISASRNWYGSQTCGNSNAAAQAIRSSGS